MKLIEINEFSKDVLSSETESPSVQFLLRDANSLEPNVILDNSIQLELIEKTLKDKNSISNSMFLTFTGYSKSQIINKKIEEGTMKSFYVSLIADLSIDEAEELFKELLKRIALYKKRYKEQQ